MKKLNIRIGQTSRILFPDFSSCECCKTTWNIVFPYHVMYSKTAGCFALCEKCWDENSIDERVAYYVAKFHNRLTYEEIETMKYNIINSKTEVYW